MKLTAFLLLISVFGVLANKSYSQTLSLNMEKVTLKEVLSKIENMSSYNFMYSEKFIDVTREVSINVENKKIEDVLNSLFAGTDVSFERKDRIIILSRSHEFNTSSVTQQPLTISGKVTDSSGGSLPGVTVVVKGTTNGSITDANGKYSLSNIPENATLQFSFVGMKTQEVVVVGKSSINVILAEETVGIEEVVAVGYGTQKKVNLTGSVSSMTSKELENRPITKTSQALSGLVSGVTVSQGSGRPGYDDSSIIIRGMGTFSSAGNSPLVLVNGLASSINEVDPNNIKSISVLKDAASASIYGTRAANGVILIETKRGSKGQLTINYNNYIGWQKATELPQFVDSYSFATLKNEANKNQGISAAYTDEQLTKFKSGSDPDNYPNVPHLRNMLNSGSGFQTNHNLSFMGGDEKNSYLFSVGYLNQEGIVDKNNYNKYNFELNFDSKIKDNLNLKVSLSGNTGETTEPRHPSGAGSGNLMDMMTFALREGPTFAGRKSDGTYGHQDYFSPEAWMDSESFIQNKSKFFLGGIDLSWKIFKDFTLSGKVGYNYNNYKNTSYLATVIFDANTSYGPNTLAELSGDNSLLTLQSLVRYEKKIRQHNFNILAGFSQEEQREDWISGSRDNFPNNSLYKLNAGASTNMNAGGSGSEWALRSYFGRLNYSFKEKYLFEANVRYDGTSRFPQKSRWGLFPSLSAGWRISEESFIKNNISWIDNLKLRASWGKLGNQNIGNYPYQNLVVLGQNYPFGGSLAAGASVTTLANSKIEWESTQVADIGFDLSILKNKLNMVFDHFHKTTSGILYNVSVSQVLGLTPSSTNAGEVKNTGFEVLLNYQTSIGKLKLGIIPNFSYVKNEVAKLASVQMDISKGLFVGHPLGAIYGYVSDGLFVNTTDIANYPTQPYSAEPGFIRYKDISGPNGVPDGKVDATYDRKVIGTSFPKYSYGTTITVDYNGFDFSLLLSGLGGFEKKMNYYQAFALFNDGQIQKWQADNRWTVNNPDPNAKYPKLTNLTSGSMITQTSTFFTKNASFLRAKSLQIGYSFSNSIVQKLRISKLRIFFSGQNLFSLNHYYEGWDPEMSTNSEFYPITSIYSFGVNIKF